jgi:Sel1 repeat
MRIATRVCVAAVAIAAVDSSAYAAELSGPIAPAPMEEKGSSQAQVWFERALSLDIGAAGAPDAVQAFAAMRRAAELGHIQAEFNVAVMLDSGRGAPRDVAQASIWYARAAASGNHRAAFNLGQLYESGEGVPANVDLSRAWYGAADLPAARERLTETKSPTDRPALVRAPEPLFPLRKSSLEPGLQQVDLVWTSSLEPEAVRFFVELRTLDARASHEAWSGFVDVSSVRLPLPPGAQNLAWRVSAVARGSANYAVSAWSVFSVPPS